MNLTFHIVAWVVLLLAVAGLYLYRKWLEDHDDHYIHLHNDAHDASIVTSQSALGKRLEMVEKAKNIALALVILYGLAIAGIAAYLGWNTTPQS